MKIPFIAAHAAGCRRASTAYSSASGHVVGALQRHIRARWASVKGSDTLVGSGFAPPIWQGMRRARRGVSRALMPATQGVRSVWPREGGVLAALAEEDKLPLPDGMYDKLLSRALSRRTPEQSGPMLRDLVCWRLRAVSSWWCRTVVGVWRASTRRHRSGQGALQPPAAERSSLADALPVTPVQWATALYVPPFDRRLVLRSAGAIEQLGARFTPGFAGVVIVEAKKDVVATIGKVVRAPRYKRGGGREGGDRTGRCGLPEKRSCLRQYRRLAGVRQRAPGMK
ncbi:MAG: hypothetical protein H6876_09450 [Hyphomicrobiaceae bacterium]|nr:hypothetical protein [Hyphomicrobiaceae bacterium]